MGWKGTLRSINAAAKATAREAEKRQKEQLKAQIAEDAAEDVQNWKNYLRDITSVHSHVAEKLDWSRLEKSNQPRRPLETTRRGDAAQQELDAYRPSFLTRLTGGEAKARERLASAVQEAKREDDRENRVASAEYDKSFSEWKADKDMAARVLSGDADAYIEVLQSASSFTDEGRIGSKISFSIKEGAVQVLPEVHGEDIIPDFRRKQLASGKLSETKMPKSEFNELYQDYVASVALRISGDVFQVLPVDEVYVTCLAEMLDSSTGHKAPTPILSVRFVRETYFSLNRTMVDPSDSLSNFVHEMKFSRTKGFSPIQPLLEL